MINSEPVDESVAASLDDLVTAAGGIRILPVAAIGPREPAMIDGRALHLSAEGIVFMIAGVTIGIVFRINGTGARRLRFGASLVATAGSIRVTPAAALLPGPSAMIN